MCKKRHYIAATALAMALAPAIAGTPSLEEMASRLEGQKCVHATASYEVLLPSATDAVRYDIALEASENAGDTLMGCDYLIDWRLPREKGESKGFSAYFTGNHYRYRDQKLQEYHYANDRTPFDLGAGVQRQAQFAELLPSEVARKLREMASDTTYATEVKAVKDAVKVKGRQRLRGYDVSEFEYEFDTETMLPKKVDMTYNPASISEQSVTVEYEWDTESECSGLSEELLREKYPEVFEKFRTSNFRVESLVGSDMPEVATPTAGGGRYIHHRGEGMKKATVFVFLDADNATAGATVKAVRKAMSAAPIQTEVNYVFGTNNAEKALETTGEAESNENVLTSGKSAIRDCGVTAYPTLLFCGTDGKVKDVHIGMNQDTAGIVLQKIMLCN